MTQILHPQKDSAHVDWLTLVSVKRGPLRKMLVGAVTEGKAMGFYKETWRDEHGSVFGQGGPAEAPFMLQMTGDPLAMRRKDGRCLLTDLVKLHADDPDARATRVDLCRDTSQTAWQIPALLNLMAQGRVWTRAKTDAQHYQTGDEIPVTTGVKFGGASSDWVLTVYDKRKERLDAAAKSGDAERLADAQAMDATTRWECRLRGDLARRAFEGLCRPRGPDGCAMLSTDEAAVACDLWWTFGHKRFDVKDRAPTESEIENNNRGRVPRWQRFDAWWSMMTVWSVLLTDDNEEVPVTTNARNLANYCAATKGLLAMLAHLGMIEPVGEEMEALVAPGLEAMSAKQQQVATHPDGPDEFATWLARATRVDRERMEFGQETTEALVDRVSARDRIGDAVIPF